MTHEEISRFYFARLAAAAVRGQETAETILPQEWRTGELDTLTGEDCAGIVQAGLEAGLRLHRFKRTMDLPRVQRVLGLLRGFDPASLLDLGSGRGAFLWPLLDAFPDLRVQAIDADPARVEPIAAVVRGGVRRLRVACRDFVAEEEAVPPSGEGGSRFDVVTALEVLEHIPEVERAVARCVAAASRAVLITVPLREDDNPEHIHLLTRRRLAEMLEHQSRVRRVGFDAVHNHLVAVATLRGEGNG